jgi:hypothetical protein
MTESEAVLIAECVAVRSEGRNVAVLVDGVAVWSGGIAELLQTLNRKLRSYNCRYCGKQGFSQTVRRQYCSVAHRAAAWRERTKKTFTSTKSR